MAEWRAVDRLDSSGNPCGINIEDGDTGEIICMLPDGGTLHGGKSWPHHLGNAIDIVNGQKAIQVCKEVIKWAKAPVPHGNNPYTYKFVQMANEILDEVNLDIKKGPLSRDEAVALAGESVVRLAESQDCEPTNRVLENPFLVEFVSTVEYTCFNGEPAELNIYYYQDKDDMKNIEELDELAWEIGGYEIVAR